MVPDVQRPLQTERVPPRCGSARARQKIWSRHDRGDAGTAFPSLLLCLSSGPPSLLPPCVCVCVCLSHILPPQLAIGAAYALACRREVAPRRSARPRRRTRTHWLDGWAGCRSCAASPSSTTTCTTATARRSACATSHRPSALSRSARPARARPRDRLQAGAAARPRQQSRVAVGATLRLSRVECKPWLSEEDGDNVFFGSIHGFGEEGGGGGQFYPGSGGPVDQSADPSVINSPVGPIPDHDTLTATPLSTTSVRRRV